MMLKPPPFVSRFVALIALATLASCSSGGCGNCTVPAFHNATPTPAVTPIPPGVTPSPLPPGVTPTPTPIPISTPTPTPAPIPPAALSCAANASTSQGIQLGAATSFAVLGASTITNTSSIPAPTIITGDIGVSPGTAITGFTSGATVTGGTYSNSGPAPQAHADLGTAFTTAAGRASTGTVPGDIGGLTIPPGVYTAAAVSVGITGTVTLDAQNNPNAVFIFQIPSSTLTANVGSNVRLIGLANACNVFWEVGSSATLNGATFSGTVMAFSSVSVGGGVVVNGRLLASNGAVTLISDTVTVPGP